MDSLQRQLATDPRFAESFKGVIIYGVAGANGSGKDALIDLLIAHGFLGFNTGDSLRQISQAVFKTTQRGSNDAPMGRIANGERATYPGGMVDLGLLDWWIRVGHLPEELRPKGLVIGSIRAVGEAQRLKEFGGKLLVVEADPHIRYDRLKMRGRFYEQNISYEQFLEEEAGEMAVGATDPTKFGMAAVIDMADLRIVNNSNDLNGFKTAAKQQLDL